MTDLTLKEADEQALGSTYTDGNRANQNAIRAFIREYLRHMDSLGYHLLPKEATEEMKRAGGIVSDQVWAAMVSAAPGMVGE